MTAISVNSSVQKQKILDYSAVGLEGRYLFFEEVFERKLVENLLEDVTQHCTEFYPTRYKWRRSSPFDLRLSQYMFEPLRLMLFQLFDPACDFLHIPRFKIGKFGMTAAALQNGGEFPLHRDSEPYPDRSFLRSLTFVYYFFSEPKQFSGGDLILYGAEKPVGEPKNFEVFEPKTNSLLLFPSRHYHEVTALQANTSDFAHSRFTLRGSFHRANLAWSILLNIKNCSRPLIRSVKPIFKKTEKLWRPSS